MPPTIDIQTLIDSIGSEPNMSVKNPNQVMETGAIRVVPSVETDDFEDSASKSYPGSIEGLGFTSTLNHTHTPIFEHVEDSVEQTTFEMYEHQDEVLLAQLNRERTLRVITEKRLQQLETELRGERERAGQLVEVLHHSFRMRSGMPLTALATNAYGTPISVPPRQKTAMYGGHVNSLFDMIPAVQEPWKRGRGRPSRFNTFDPEAHQSEDQEIEDLKSEPPEPEKKRGRGRPRKITTELEAQADPDLATVEPEAQPKRGRGRPKKQVETTKVTQHEHYDEDSSPDKHLKFGRSGQPTVNGSTKVTQATRRVYKYEAAIVETISGVQFGTFGGIPLPASVITNLEDKVAEWQSKNKDWESHYKPGSSQCVDRKASGSSGPSAWTANDTKRACCRICFNGQSACVRWLSDTDMFVVLPLPEEARVGKKPDEESYWLYPKGNASREIKVSPGLPVWE